MKLNAHAWIALKLTCKVHPRTTNRRDGGARSDGGGGGEILRGDDDGTLLLRIHRRDGLLQRALRRVAWSCCC